ncbi:MAG: DUF2141 domain-containing protein [Spirochaetota bacterium]
MKHIVAVFLAVVLIAPLTASDTAVLTVTFTDIDPAEGQLLIALCNSKENFEKRVEPFKKMKESVNGSTVTVNFTGIPAGEYAVKVVHDENSNDKMDTNLVGMPKEGFGFSNNAMGKMGPPDYGKAKVTVAGDTTITVKMKYL